MTDDASARPGGTGPGPIVERDVSVELLLHAYPPITDAVRPLADLARQNPSMTDDVIRFAMALGIRAADRAWIRSLAPTLAERAPE